MKDSMRTRKAYLSLAALAGVSALVATPMTASAAVLFYTGGNGTLWSSATSFTPNATPGASDSVSMSNTAGTNTFDLATRSLWGHWAWLPEPWMQAAPL